MFLTLGPGLSKNCRVNKELAHYVLLRVLAVHPLLGNLTRLGEHARRTCPSSLSSSSPVVQPATAMAEHILEMDWESDGRGFALQKGAPWGVEGVAFEGLWPF